MVTLLSQPAVAIKTLFCVEEEESKMATLTTNLELSLRLSKMLPSRSLATSWPDMDDESRMRFRSTAQERMGESWSPDRDAWRVNVVVSTVWSRRSADDDRRTCFVLFLAG